ncbi:methylosome subunit pICln-like isoform X3 [Carassius carassius]|uniref:methylosome subunit pICln-like isoform X3 n=2 Tax=Carassius carassius TaxID=217509 RepID=UPI00286975AA|nr:methylosome subunit pICln-like isoform X3 [Carassius carassius]
MVVLKSLHPPSEGVRLQQPDTTAFVDGKRLGSGTLFVAEAHLSWFDGSGMGFCLEYPSISLHAVSRDLSAFPEEHLYVMVNAKLDDEAEAEQLDKASDDEESNSDDEDSGTITEIRFVPSDKAALEPMFSSMCDCQALHPDPDDVDTDDDDYEGEEYDVEEAEQEQGQHQVQGDVPMFYSYEEGLSQLTAEGQATLERLEGMLAQSITQQYHMAGVRNDEPSAQFEGMEVDSNTVAGQFDDADVDHW